MDITNEEMKNNDEHYKKYTFSSTGGNETCIFYQSAMDGNLDGVPWKLVNMSYKLLNVDSKLLLTLLANHGFCEVRYYKIILFNLYKSTCECMCRCSLECE